MSTLMRNHRVVGGQLDLGRHSTVLECSLLNVTVVAVEGEAQIVRSTLQDCDLRKVPAAALDDCDIVNCRLPRDIDARRNRVRPASP